MATQRIIWAGLRASALAMAMMGGAGTVWAQSADTIAHDQAAQAGEGLADIIVTARRTEESAQRTPVAITAISAEALQQHQIANLAGVQYAAPNINIVNYPGDPTSIAIQMRGQVQTDLVATSDPAVGVYVDGVYLGRGNSASLATLDLARIEVLRGPQGTLFGRNTTGGALNILTRDPQPKLEGFVSGRLGSYNLAEISGALNVPLGDDLAVRAAFQHSSNDGYFKSRVSGEGLQGSDENSGRIKLRWTPGSVFKVDLSADYSRNNTDGSAFKLYQVTPGAALNRLPTTQPLVANGRSVDSYIDGARYANDTNIDNRYLSELWGASATLAADLGQLELKSITAYRELKRLAAFDYDGTPYTIAEANSIDLRQHQVSQELQANGKAIDGRLSYTAGLFFFTEHARDITRSYFLAGLAPPPYTLGVTDGEVTNTSYAAYAQATFAIAEHTRVTAGIRYTRDRREFTSRSRALRTQGYNGPVVAEICSVTALVRPDPAVCEANFAKTFGYWSYTFGVDQQVTDDILAYVRTGRSYKAGGYNIRSTTVPDSFAPFNPEQLTDYEVGIKADFLDHHVRNNLAVFYSDYRDMQRTLQVATPAGPNPSANFTTNAKKAHIFGIEEELTARFGGLTFGIAGGYLKPVYDEYSDTAPPFTDRRNEPFIVVSKYNVTVNAQYAFDTGFGEFRVGGDYSYRTKFYFAPQDTIFQPGYGIANVQAGFDPKGLPGLSLGAFVRNVGDTYYNVYMLQIPALGFASVTPGAPRTWGVSASYRF